MLGPSKWRERVASKRPTDCHIRMISGLNQLLAMVSKMFQMLQEVNENTVKSNKESVSLLLITRRC